METKVSKEERKQKVNIILGKVEEHCSAMKNILISIRDACCNCEANRIIAAFQRSSSPSQLMNDVCQMLQEIKNINDFLKSGRCNIHTPLETLVSNQIFELTQLKSGCTKMSDSGDSRFITTNDSSNEQSLHLSEEGNQEDTHEETHEDTQEPGASNNHYEQDSTANEHSSNRNSNEEGTQTEEMEKIIEEIDISGDSDDEPEISNHKCKDCFVKLAQVPDSIIKMASHNASISLMKMKIIENGRTEIVVKREKLSSDEEDSSCSTIENREDIETVENPKDVESKIQMVFEKDQTRFICPVCGSFFASRQTAVNHLSIHATIDLLKCRVCGKRFNQRIGLRRHVLDVHVRVSTPSVTRRRGHRSNSSSTSNSIGSEVNEDESEEMNVTELYEKIDNRKGQHLNSPLKKEKVSVDFDENSTLSKESETDNKNGDCDDSSKVDEERRGFYSKLYVDNNQFCCRECGKRFKRKFDAVRHLNVHNPKLCCESCRRQFRSKYMYNKHVRKFHKSTSNAPLHKRCIKTTQKLTD